MQTSAIRNLRDIRKVLGGCAVVLLQPASLFRRAHAGLHLHRHLPVPGKRVDPDRRGGLGHNPDLQALAEDLQLRRVRRQRKKGHFVQDRERQR